MSRFRNEINSILKALQNGKTERRQDLCKATYNHLKYVAYSYAQDKSEWRDILHEAYLRAFRYIGTADLEKDGYNWLCRIVQRVAYDFSDKAHRIGYVYECTAEDLECNLIEQDDLLLAVSQLSKTDQEMLHKMFWEDKSCRRIAEEMAMSKSNVYKRITALKKFLEKKLK